jgi:glycosyltransferase involved in cell wall biosynthesis
VDLSVVIAARDAAETLDEQLTALAAQEWHGAWEVVVVDNGSTDDTRGIVRRSAERWPALRLVEATDGVGPAFARNVGAREATGRSLAFCDADDVVAPGWLAAVGDALDTAEFVCGPIDIETLNPPWLAASRGTTGTTAAAVFEGRFPFASSCNLGIRRARFLAANGFDEDLLVGEDIDLSMRLFVAGVTLAYVPGALVRYRFRPTLRSTFDRAVAYGRARPLIAERWRARVPGAEVPRFRGVRNYGWLVRHAPTLTSRAGRARWLWVAGQLAGTVSGSRRVGRLYL